MRTHSFNTTVHTPTDTKILKESTKNFYEKNILYETFMNKNHALMKIQTHDTWDVGRVVVIFNETKNKGEDDALVNYSGA